MFFPNKLRKNIHTFLKFQRRGNIEVDVSVMHSYILIGFQQVYCTEEYRKLKGHTMCFTDLPNVSKQGMTEREKRAVLKQHNDLRGRVEPPATDLAKLVRL